MHFISGGGPYAAMTTAMRTELLRLGSWNLNGLGVKQGKLSDPQFLETLTRFDIFGISETWLAQKDAFTVRCPEGYGYAAYV